MSKYAVERARRSLWNVFCRLGVSTISGVGVFAIRPIPKGINPFPDTKSTQWEKIPISCLGEVHPNIAKMVNDFGTREGENIWIPKDGFNNLGMCYYLNHSEIPNMMAMDDGDYFIAIRDIEEGEELTVDYSSYDEEGHATQF